MMGRVDENKDLIERIQLTCLSRDMQITLRIPMVRLVPPLQTWLVIGVREICAGNIIAGKEALPLHALKSLSQHTLRYR